jgi:hypothetical protein
VTVVARRGHHLGHRPAPVERHEHVAQRVAGGVERDRQRELWTEPGEAADAGDHARGRYRDVAGAEPEPTRVVQGLDRGQHPIEVEQRLAHPHEHDIGQPPAIDREAARGAADLVDDLRNGQIAPEPELAGCAERAADRATRLARDAQGVPLRDRSAG